MKKLYILIILVISFIWTLIFLTGHLKEDPKEPVFEEHSEEVTEVSIVAEDVEGDYYFIGTGISTIINKYVDNIEASCTSASSSLDNIRHVNDGKEEFTFATSYLTQLAYDGLEYYSEQPLEKIRVVAALYPQTAQFVVPKKLGLETIGDLENKKVSVGLYNSEKSMIAASYLSAHGLTFDDVEVDYLDDRNALEALKSEEIDCVFISSKVPERIIADASAILEIDLLEIDSKEVNNLISTFPLFETETILPRTYKGIHKYVLTGSVPVFLVTGEGVDDDTVYRITKSIFENGDELASIHNFNLQIKDTEIVWDFSIPLHSGAERYYIEKGILE
jgi:hypothetical protein